MLIRSGVLARAGAAAPPTPSLSAAFGVGDYPGDGGGTLRITWSVTDGVGGEYVDIDYDVTGGNPITDTGPGTSNGNGASPVDISVALGVNAQAEATVRLYSAGAVLLDTVVLPDTFLPT